MFKVTFSFKFHFMLRDSWECVFYLKVSAQNIATVNYLRHKIFMRGFVATQRLKGALPWDSTRLK